MPENNFLATNVFGMKVPGFPIDHNNVKAPVLMGAVVDASGAITKYLPIRCKDNGNGTCTPYVDVSG